MEVILLEKIENLGNLGDKVVVKAGYGRNYLIPKAKATAATAENIAKFEARRAELEQAAAQSLDGAERRRQALDGTVVTIAAIAGNEGRLYGSVSVAEIADALSKAGSDVKRQEIVLSQGPIRQVGEYDVTVKLHSDVSAPVRVHVVAEE